MVLAKARVGPTAPVELKWLVAAALAGRFHSTAGNVVVVLTIQG